MPDRKYVIIDDSEVVNIDFNEVLETSGTGLVAYLRWAGATGTQNFYLYTGADSDGTGGNPTFKVDNVSVKQVNGNPGTLVNTPTFSTDIP